LLALARIFVRPAPRAQLHQTRRLTQPQHLHEQTPQGRQVPLPEQVDRPEVRLLQRRHRHEIHRSSQARAIRRDE